MPEYSNQLINESSPYLLQHAHNPVDWYPWGTAALERAKQEDKPILVSIGYAACHWCHVMERESFEDPETAALMNELFINIKIDREERPDLDHIYMDAVQAMTGSGGWPLNVFLTPEAKPFYGGTYFPPRRAYNRPSWQETLQRVAQAFREKRNEINAQAENLTEHLQNANAFGLQKNTGEEFFSRDRTREIRDNLLKQADREWGGFGRAPKFPQTGAIRYLLQYHFLTGDAASLEQAQRSLDKMIEGGIYDQAGGGFARYSTDTEWLVPHFEKMLYDNALLVSVLSEAYQLTQKESYREVIQETMGFIEREMLDESGGFYAALDADSEGVEGKFYVWTRTEVEALLGADAEVFSEYYDITEKGNWEGVSILRVREPLEAFAARKQLDQQELKNVLQRGCEQLLAQRAQRVRPQLDDKIILGWNALLNTAASKAYAATGQESYRALAIRNMEFLLSHFREAAGRGLHHTWKKGVAKYPAFLEDYAFLIEALLALQEITADTRWLEEARAFTAYVQEQFAEQETGYFFYTPAGQQDVIVRKKEVYDGAVPSGNAVMAANLHRLGILLDRSDWQEQSLRLTAALGQAITRYPTSFGYWACLLQEQVEGTQEIAILGPDYAAFLKEVNRQYIPHRVLMAAPEPQEAYPLLAGKTVVRSTSIQLCRNYTCQRPVFSAEELMLLINSSQNQ